MKNLALKTESSQWKESLDNARDDLKNGKTEGLRSFLDEHAPSLTYNEVLYARNVLIVNVRHKSERVLVGAALKAHASRVQEMFRLLNDIIGVKYHYHLAHKKKMHEKKKQDTKKSKSLRHSRKPKPSRVKKYGQKRHLRLVSKPAKGIQGKREKHTIKGAEVELIIGSSRKDKCIFQIVKIIDGRLKGVSEGVVYSVDALPFVLEEYFYPERAARKKAKRAEKQALKLESKKSKKNNKGDKKGRKAKQAKKAA